MQHSESLLQLTHTTMLHRSVPLSLSLSHTDKPQSVSPFSPSWLHFQPSMVRDNTPQPPQAPPCEKSASARKLERWFLHRFSKVRYCHAFLLKVENNHTCDRKHWMYFSSSTAPALTRPFIFSSDVMASVIQTSVSWHLNEYIYIHC